MKLQHLINELAEAGFQYEQIEAAIRNLRLTSTTISEGQKHEILKELGAVSGDPGDRPTSADEKKHQSGGLTEASPTGIDESVQQIHAREMLSRQSIQQLEQQYAAITGRQDAIHEETLKITRRTAYNATRLEYRLAEIQRQKEIMVTQSNSDINSFLADLGIANPLSVCAEAVAMAEESLATIEQLHREKKS